MSRSRRRNRKKPTLDVYFDGACLDNPGGMSCYGVAAYLDGSLIHQERGVASSGGEHSTCNVAEFYGMLRALCYLRDSGLYKIYPARVLGDSRLVINVMNGRWTLHAEHLLPIYYDALECLRYIGQVEFVWVPREQNKEADKQSLLAYVDFAGMSEDEVYQAASKFDEFRARRRAGGSAPGF